MVKILALASLAFTQTAMADVNAYQQAATQFCNKVKMCITEEVKKETGGEVPTQMKDIIDSMTSKMCEQYMPEQIMRAPSQYAEMIEAGTQCLQDLAAVPCEQMSSADEPASCKEAQLIADKLGLDTSN